MTLVGKVGSMMAEKKERRRDVCEVITMPSGFLMAS